MRVITLHPQAFAAECGRLGREALKSGPYDLIVGIRTGGARVADAVCSRTEALGAVARHDVRLQRASTPARTGAAKGWLCRLPRPLLDLLRMAESLWDARHAHQEEDVERARARLEIPTECLKAMEADRPRSILVIDDAVDSGVTLSATVDALRELCPEARIVTAVLTVTRPDAIISPDIALHRDRTLIRFPWSNDYRP